MQVIKCAEPNSDRIRCQNKAVSILAFRGQYWRIPENYGEDSYAIFGDTSGHVSEFVM
jgi:hypothetical protein